MEQENVEEWKGSSRLINDVWKGNVNTTRGRRGRFEKSRDVGKKRGRNKRKSINSRNMEII